MSDPMANPAGDAFGADFLEIPANPLLFRGGAICGSGPSFSDDRDRSSVHAVGVAVFIYMEHFSPLPS